MLPAPLRLFHPHAASRVAEIGAEAVAPGQFQVVLRRGPSRSSLRPSETFGPLSEAELGVRMQALHDQLRSEGYLPPGLHALLADLTSTSALRRARTAARLGWRRERLAVESLLAALPGSTDDTCALLDALGAIGDPRAIPTLRHYAARKLLSRRRSAVEALRLLGDTEGLQLARTTTLEQMPAPVQLALGAATLATAMESLDPQFKGLALDTLYELNPPGCDEVIRQVLATLAFDRAYVWRYVKSILKRAMLRHDYAMFGWLYHEIEVRGRDTSGTVESVKSGRDGVMRPTRIFSRQTQWYLRGQTWRWLQLLTKWRPDRYAHAAAEVVIPFTPEDEHRWGDLDGLPNNYAVQQILHGNNPNLLLIRPSWRFYLRHVKAPWPQRVEMFPKLWDAQPRAYLRLLAARHPGVHPRALQALTGPFRHILHEASTDEIAALLSAPYEPTIALGMQELQRRFDPERPSWPLLLRLLTMPVAPAWSLVLDWLAQTTAHWRSDAELMLGFLNAIDAETRLRIARLIVTHLTDDPAVRRPLAEALLTLLRQPEGTPGAHEAIAVVAREALAAEIAELMSSTEFLVLLTRGSPAVQSVAGAAIGARPAAVEELGLERIAALAMHEVASVRAAAVRLIRSAIDRLRTDPALLFVLAECEWPDTREAALDLIRHHIDLPRLGLDAFIGLIDSNRPDVQRHGRDLILRHLDELPILDLLERLIEHPAALVRHFALDLVIRDLPGDADSLAQALPFCRALLLDVWPSRWAKRRVLDFLMRRGLSEARQAELVSSLLAEVVRVQTRGDSERALEGLARIALAYPEVQTAVRVRGSSR